MNYHVRMLFTVLALFMILPAPVWAAPAENLMSTSYYKNNPFDNSAFFFINDAKVSFNKTSRSFTASSKDVTLFDPDHHLVPLRNEFFSLQATTNPSGSSATGHFVFGSSGGGGGYGLGPGILFQGSITDVGWSNSLGFLEFAISNFSGKLCDLGWCSTRERIWLDTRGKLGIVDKNGKYLSFSKTMDGIAIVPVPAAAWLLGSGLIGLIGIARRKKSA